MRREISLLFKLVSLRSIIASLNHIDNKPMILITKYMTLIEKTRIKVVENRRTINL